MQVIKPLFLIFFLVSFVCASTQKDIVFVENLDSNALSLKEEFFKPDSKYFTITLATINIKKYDPIRYFKINKIKNAVAYKLSKESSYGRVILGLYETIEEAQQSIDSLSSTLKRNKPYVSRLSTHQRQFDDNKINKKNKQAEKKSLDESIIIPESKNSQELKNEFISGTDSKYYSIAVGTINYNENQIKNFFERNNIEDKALAHVYGKKKDKVRIIYGLYKTKDEAIEAIKEFNDTLKMNKPYSRKLSNFQNFYRKNFPNDYKNSIVKLKIEDTKSKELSAKPELSDEIKVMEGKKDLPPKPIEKKVEPKKQIQKVVKEEKKEVAKKQEAPKKVLEKQPLQKENRFLKVTKHDDVYYVESEGNFNILGEVFLNTDSSFYTIDLGELSLADTSIEEYYKSNGLEDNSLAYKYGDNKEYARIIYGAYESKDEASSAINNLDIPKENVRVSNIQNHQKLYKTYHKEITKKKTPEQTTSVKSEIYYLQSNEQNNLKDEFFNRNTQKYTISLITFLKNEIDLNSFIRLHELNDNTLIYSIGSNDEYYKLFYKVFDTFSEAKEALENLPYGLQINQPYVSKIRTNQRKFENYNNRRIEDYKDIMTKYEIR